MSTPKHIQLLQKLFEVIRHERVDEIAKETGFIQRKRLISASASYPYCFMSIGI